MSELRKMALSAHTRLQHYDRHYCKTFVTGIYGCRWQRYQQSKEPTALIDQFYFVLVTLTWALSTFWLYFWLVTTSNDFDNVNFFMSASLGVQFYDFDGVFIGLSSTLFVYSSLLMILAIVHIYQSHELYLNKVHKIILPFITAFCVAQIFIVNGQYKEGWSLCYLSFQVFGPFLHIGGVVIATMLSFVVARRWNGLYSLGRKLLLLWFYCCVMLVIYVSPLFLESPLISSSPLPPRPNFVTHRGLTQVAPENTKMAFARAMTQEGVISIESDVTISWDGVPYLMHDHNLVRTTNVGEVFPNKTTMPASDFTLQELKQLNAGSWYINRDPFGTVHRLNESDKEEIKRQDVPTLAEILGVLSTSRVGFMFDIVFFSAGKHPYKGTYKQRIVDIILNSGIDHKRIWWLYYKEKDSFNGTADFTAVQPGSPDVEQLLADGVFITNMRYDQVHLELQKSYVLNNISSVVYTINSHWLFSYAWCAGVSLVSTDYAADFSLYTGPIYRMSPDVYNSIWITVDCLSAVVAFAMFFGIWVRNRGSVFNPETLSLQSAKTHLVKNKTMKEKLIHAAEGIQDTELGIIGMGHPESPGVRTGNSTDNSIVVSNASRSTSIHSNRTEVSVQDDVR